MTLLSQGESRHPHDTSACIWESTYHPEHSLSFHGVCFTVFIALNGRLLESTNTGTFEQWPMTYHRDFSLNPFEFKNVVFEILYQPPSLMKNFEAEADSQLYRVKKV